MQRRRSISPASHAGGTHRVGEQAARRRGRYGGPTARGRCALSGGAFRVGTSPVSVRSVEDSGCPCSRAHQAPPAPRSRGVACSDTTCARRTRPARSGRLLYTVGSEDREWCASTGLADRAIAHTIVAPTRACAVAIDRQPCDLFRAWSVLSFAAHPDRVQILPSLFDDDDQCTVNRARVQGGYSHATQPFTAECSAAPPCIWARRYT